MPKKDNDEDSRFILHHFAPVMEKLEQISTTVSFSRDMEIQFNNPQWSDVTFETLDGEKIFASRLVLASRCEKLREQLEKEAPSCGCIIKIPYNAESFKDVLIHLYTGYFGHINTERADKVFEIAKHYELGNLQIIAAAHSKKGIVSEDLLQMMSYAANSNQKFLTKYFKKLIQRNSKSWLRQKKFNYFPYGFMRELVSDNSLLPLSEYSVFKIVEDWIHVHSESVTKEQSIELLRYIRYPRMNFEELFKLKSNDLVPQYLLDECFKFVSILSDNNPNGIEKLKKLFPEAIKYKRFQNRGTFVSFDHKSKVMPYTISLSSPWTALANTFEALTDDSLQTGAGTNYQDNPYIEFTMKHHALIKEVEISSFVNDGGGWGEYYTNGRHLEYSNDKKTWHNLHTLNGHSSAIPTKKYTVNTLSKYWRVTCTGTNYIGFSRILFHAAHGEIPEELNWIDPSEGEN